MRVRGQVQVLALLVLAAACDESTGPNINDVPGYSISRVIVTPSSAAILVPDTITSADEIQFSAIAIGKSSAALTGIRFVWSTSDASIAVVDSSGVVTPVRPGTVEIIASAYKQGKATLEIIPATQTVTVSPLRDTIYVDEPIVAARDTARLTPEARDPFNQVLTGIAFSWQSTSTGVASVDANGLVHATGLGTANVIVEANGRNSSSQITVLPLVAQIDLTSPASQVLALDTLQLSAVAKGYTGTTIARTFTWTSSNPSVATVDANGRVVFLSTGQATFTARTAHRTSAVTVTALDRRLIAMDAGGDFTCGIANLGRGYCWGLSSFGRTAAAPDSSCFDPTSPCILPPKRMNRPEIAFTKLSAGEEFACGIATDQRLYCWGRDEQGQVGNGADGAGATPSLTTVKNERFTAISAGTAHACALNLAGRAYCWGSDSHGQLGDHGHVNSTTPIPVLDSLTTYRAISAGARHTCAITAAGAARCWGDGTSGQLGNGTAASSDVPVLVSGNQNFIEISAGERHTCAVESSGSVYCWGANNFGQLGIGATGAAQLTPVQLPGSNSFTAIAAGAFHTCGISNTHVSCWGWSEYGEVGDGNVLDHNVPAPFVVGLQAMSISAGAKHTCAISLVGEAMCWGSNIWGALGNEFQAGGRATPQVVARLR